ncbi:MAG: N-acetyl-gamma-glutamyl-phosphate reductase [Mariprofundaceae bacterium]|nr:N-acetyl-gamma-glutamyl-phosphate reductase [Mariprofundaceae bacterium]
MKQIATAIFGATGYTGAELIRLIDAHPMLRIAHMGAHSQAGKRAGEVLPGISGEISDMPLLAADAPFADGVELVFTALPHGAAAASVKKALDAGCRVVDLSTDFRHQSAATYAEAYGQAHPFPELLNDAVFGLSEYARSKIANAQLVANPGCYPTCTLLPLLPLLKAGLIDTSRIIVDAKSGTSGAGRSAKTDLLYCEVNEGVRAYGLPRHRHVWEMEEWGEAFSGRAISVQFVPHILPMTRGMLATLHLSGENPASWHALLTEAYADEAFVRVLAEGSLPSSKAVNGSNRCDIGLCVTGKNSAVVVACLDNLLKGAAGQAVQNANIMFGFDETLALSAHALWP